jgi:hypothetical protein
VNAQAVGIANGFWTTVVDGVSVTINGKNAFVGFISGGPKPGRVEWGWTIGVRPTANLRDSGPKMNSST